MVLLVARALRPQGVRLDDGTYLRLLAVTTGPQHQFSTGLRYESAPYRWLPARLRDRMGWRPRASVVQVTDADSLMVWYSLFIPGTTTPPSRLFRSVDLIGPTGDRIAAGAQSRVLLTDGSGAGLVLFPGLAAVPEGARLRFQAGTTVAVATPTLNPAAR
ncbi:MAG: hypothetical protein J0L84_12895 [Verrucomicrobia bacterium]|nr:hypothetical protein [Verrucomicrobiota bacterium]